MSLPAVRELNVHFKLNTFSIHILCDADNLNVLVLNFLKF